MEKSIFPEELNILIQQYLTDGVLTDKERQVILKKAEGMGLDRDEVDLYLDAEVQKIDQQTDAAVRRQKGKQCPYCGAPIPQLADKCPECGQFITPEASKELQDILDKLENALVDLKSGKDIELNKAIVEKYTRKAKLYYSNHPKIKSLLLEVDNELNLAVLNARKHSLISIFTSLRFWSIVALVVGIFCGLMSSFRMGSGFDGPATDFIAGSIVGFVIDFLKRQAAEEENEAEKEKREKERRS